MAKILSLQKLEAAHADIAVGKSTSSVDCGGGADEARSTCSVGCG